MIRQFGDARDILRAASEYLKDIQRDGWNVNLYELVVELLPDPNNSNQWEHQPPDLLREVQHSICEQQNGKFQYAMIPVVAGAVATKFANTSEQFKSIAGLHQGGWRGQIRNDLFYWNHYNHNRLGMRPLTRSMKWLFHSLKNHDRFEAVLAEAAPDFQGKKPAREIQAVEFTQ
jgi:hypothetical protein